MEILRPLIFLDPISDTLKKLRQVIEPSSEKEGIEIFDIESIDEMEVIFRQIGQSLVMVSNPKMCVLLIKAHKKLIKKFKIKIILLSKSPLNKVALDKLMKAGLTENIVEPVAPKTLIYKVRLHLRSIQPNTKPKEMTKKFDLKSLQAKDINSEAQKKKNNITEKIDNTMKGKISNNKEEENKKGNPLFKNQKNPSLGGHYKGLIKKSLADKNKDEKPKASEKKKNKVIDDQKRLLQKEIEELENDLRGLLKKNINNSDSTKSEKEKINTLEEQIKDKKKKLNKKNIEEENLKKESITSPDVAVHSNSKKKNLSTEKTSESHYKGSIGESIEDLDDYSRDSNFKESLQEIQKSKSNYQEVEINSKQSHDSQGEDEDNQNAKQNKRSRLNLKNDSSSAKDIDEKPESDPKYSKNKHLQLIDKSENETEIPILEEDLYARKKKAKMIELESSMPYHLKKKKNQDEKKKKSKASNGSEKQNSIDHKQKDQDRLEALRRNRATKNIDLDENDLKGLLSEIEEEKLNKNKSKNNVMANNKKRKSNYSEGISNKRNKSNYSEALADSKANKSDAHADKIETHYSNKKGIDHTGEEWNSYWHKKQKEEEQLRLDEQTLYYEKKKIGEQTIDYRKLKESFEGMEAFKIKHEMKNAENYNEKDSKLKQIVDNDKNFNSFDNNIDNNQDQENSILFEDISDVELQDVFEPNAFGFEHIISIMDSYQVQGSNINSIATKISNIIFKEFNGYTTFYSYNKNINSYQCEYNSFEQIKLSEKPIKPNQNKLNNKEFKVRMKEYQDDIKNFKNKKEEILEQWKALFSDDEKLWQEQDLPYWKDHLFIQDNQQFIYPIKEGLNKIGFIAIVFDKNIEKGQDRLIEIIIESSRGIFLEWSHNLMRNETNYNSTKEIKSEVGKVSSILKGIGSFFKRKKAA